MSMGDESSGRQRSVTREAVARFVFFSLLTVLAAHVGHLTLDESLGLSLVWPLNGVAALWIASGSRRTWTWDTIGLVVVVGLTILVDENDPARAVLAGTLAAATAWTWTLVVRRLAPTRDGLDRPRSLVEVAVVLLACGASALVGALLRTWGMGLLPTYDAETFVLLLIRNYSGILAPVVLGALLVSFLGRARRRSELRNVRLHRAGRRVGWALETVGMLLTTAGVSVLVFSGTVGPIAFLLVLAVVWAAFRQPPVIAVALAVTLGVLAVVATFRGSGQFFVDGQPFFGAAMAQGYLITLVVAALAISVGIEERREAMGRARSAEAVAEDRARLLDSAIAHIADGVSVIGADGEYVVRNPASFRVTGPDGLRRPDPAGPGQLRLSDTDGRPLTAERLPWRRSLAGEDVVREVVRMRYSTGEERVVEVTAVRVEQGEGRAPVVVTTSRDVTTEEHERDQLVSFAGVVAHDLKNPLTVIRGWSESIQEELGADAPPDLAVLGSMVGRVQTAADQMRMFIDDLLGFAVARDRPLTIEDLDVSALAEEVAELRRVTVAQPRIVVLPGMRAAADRFLVRQVLDNLVANAVKYVAPGVAPVVTITGRELGSMLEVSVSDNGIGIPPEMRPRVFDSFARVSEQEYSGTGLGLAICERVVSRHGGRIWIDESVDRGTRVNFTLPAVAPVGSPTSRSAHESATSEG